MQCFLRCCIIHVNEKKETCITNKKEKKNYEKNENYSLRSGTVDNGVHTAVV